MCPSSDVLISDTKKSAKKYWNIEKYPWAKEGGIDGNIFVMPSCQSQIVMWLIDQHPDNFCPPYGNRHLMDWHFHVCQSSIFAPSVWTNWKKVQDALTGLSCWESFRNLFIFDFWTCKAFEFVFQLYWVSINFTKHFAAIMLYFV